MLLIICILLLALSVSGKPVDRLLGRIKSINWKEAVADSWNSIVKYSKKAGRDATRTALLCYYTLRDGDLTLTEKALLYAGIVYVIVPVDFLPRKVLGILGILDDVAVSALIFDKIRKNITPEINQKVEETLAAWFGPEIVTERVR